MMSHGRGVLESAFALLGALEKADGAGLTCLAAQAGLPKTTAHRLLEQLSTLGAVERGRGGYRLGARVFQLGHDWQPHPGLRTAAHEPVRRLAAATGAAVAVSVLRNNRVLTVDWAPAADRPPVQVRRGSAWPWFTAAGKVLVALAPSPECRPPADAVAGPACGSGNATDPAGRSAPPDRAVADPAPDAWLREAATIRRHAMAFDHENVLPGICCVAVPLYSAPGAPVASLAVVTDPAHRLDRLAEVACRAGATISAALRRLPRPPS